MNILYLFLIYKNPQIVSHTISKLQHPNSKFYIHVDKNSNCDFSILNQYPNVYWAQEQFATEWGSVNIPMAIESCLRDINKNIQTDYIILMSESDYPIKSAQYIHHFFLSASKDFITSTKLPNHNPLNTKGSFWIEGGRRRLECYPVRLNAKKIATIEPRCINVGNFRQFAKTFLYDASKLPKAIRIWQRAPKRRHPNYLYPYGGEMWFCLRNKCVKKIIDFLDKHPDYKPYSKNTTVLDEIYFPTLVNAVVPKEEIANDHLRYINWGEKGDSPADISLNEKDIVLKQIQQPAKLFIRKVQDFEVCKFIDEQIKLLGY